MDLFGFFTQVGFGILFTALIIVMFVAVVWLNAALQRGAFLNAGCALLLLIACIIAAGMLSSAQKSQSKPAHVSSPTHASSVGVLFPATKKPTRVRRFSVA